MKTTTNTQQVGPSKSNTRYYSLREARSIDELASFLSKRYRIFRDSNLSAAVPENESGLDLDAYDATSYHLGLFAGRADGSEDLVGYVRIIGESTTPRTPWIHALAARSRGHVRDVENEREHVLPSFGYFPDVGDIYDSRRRNGETMVEASRLGIDPEARSSAAGRFLILGVTAIWYALGMGRVVFSCVPAHRKFYTPLGAQPVDGVCPRYVPEIGVVGMCLTMTRATMTPEARELIEPIAASFAIYGDVRSAPNPNQRPRRHREAEVAVRHSEDAASAVV